MRKIVYVLLLALVFAALSGCSVKESTDIAATTLPVYEFTARLCQNTPITVERLVTESVSCLHDYSLKVSQMRAIADADMVIASGGGLEAFLDDALDSAAQVVDSSTDIQLLCPDSAHEHEHKHGHEHEHDHHHSEDPHFWLDPRCAKTMSQNICNALVQKYPQYQDTFETNLTALQKDLDALYEYGRNSLSELSCRELITFHDGFAYFADAFDLHILKAIEEEPGSETSAAQLKELIVMVQEHKMPGIFVEKNGSSASAAVIAAEAGIEVYTLDMAMSGSSYFEAMYHNINTIKEALG